MTGREYIWWGNGIAGINKAFSKKDIVNSLSTTVAIDEIRAGIASMDSRGSWALGQIGCSITHSHGVFGDATGPNCQRRTADRIVGAMELMRVLGRTEVMREGMPCPFYFYAGASTATARSKHPGGVNVLMLDGSAHFVSDLVDLNIWHAIHSRKTPEKISLDSLAVEADPEALDVTFYGPYPVELKELAALCATPPQKETPRPFANSIGMKFVRLPAGEFVMGMPDVGRGVAYQAATPAHVVHITKPFSLGVYAVTQDEYRKVMKRNPSWYSPTGGGKDQLQGEDAPYFGEWIGQGDEARYFRRWKPDGFDGTVQMRGKDTSSFPVESVSWYDAVEFCRQLSELPVEKEMERRYRLPTEAEWEYACRAGSTAQGDGKMAHSIGLVYLDKPNAFGVCGMKSSVWEWCSDGFSRYYYARSPKDDPQGTSSVYLRVVRGSEWTFTQDFPCSWLNPRAFPPSARSRFLGFRVVCTKETR